MEALLSLVLGMVVILIGRYIFSNQRYLLKNGVQTIGRVRKFHESGSSRQGTFFYAMVSFKDRKGDIFEAEFSYGTTNKRYDIGQKLDILYDPKNPLNVSPLKTPGLRALSVSLESIGYGLIVYAIILIA